MKNHNATLLAVTRRNSSSLRGICVLSGSDRSTTVPEASKAGIITVWLTRMGSLQPQ